jgi:hypothetical protein
VFIYRNNTGALLVQYLLTRRLVLEEVLNQPLGCPGEDPILHRMIEFGIKHYRDIFFVNFKAAKKTDGKYFKVDPRHEANKDFLSMCLFVTEPNLISADLQLKVIPVILGRWIPLLTTAGGGETSISGRISTERVTPP